MGGRYFGTNADERRCCCGDFVHHSRIFLVVKNKEHNLLQYIYISNHNIPSQYILLDCLAELGLTVASFQSERKSIEKV